METQKFQGIEKSKLLAIPDEELKEVLFAPGYDEYLKIGAFAFVILFFGSFLIDASSEIASNAGTNYIGCNSQRYQTMGAGGNLQEICDALRSEVDANGISTKEEYVAFKTRQFETDPSNYSNVVRMLGTGIFVLAAALALVKRSNPFFMTKISSDVEIQYEKDKMESFKIAGKKLGKGFVERGVMIRKFASRYCIVSFYYSEGVDRAMRKFGPTPAAERVVMNKEQAEKFADGLDVFKNIKAEVTDDSEIIASFR